MSRPGRSQSRVPEVGRLMLIGADVILVGVALLTAYLLRFHLELGALAEVGRPPLIEYAKAYVLLALAIGTLCRFHDLYRLDLLHTPLEETYALARSVGLATGGFLALTFFYRGFSYSRLTFVYFAGTGTVLLALNHAVFRRWLTGRYERGLDLRRTAIVGQPSGYLIDRLASDRSFGLAVLGYVGEAAVPLTEEEAGEGPSTSLHSARGERGENAQDARSQERRGDSGSDSGPLGSLLASAGYQPNRSRLVRLGEPDDLLTILREHEVDEVVIFDHGLSHRRLLETIDTCEALGVEVRLVPPIYDLLIQPSDFTYVGNIPLIRVDERRFHRVRFFWKRLFDIAVSGVLLLLASLLLAVLAWLIRRDSDGPALFVQERAGEAGRPFRMLKFRTMVADAEARIAEVVDVEGLEEPVFKVANDPRVTRIGALLRRSSLDELPQLWNVLKGDMSLVGPRPEQVSLVEQYDVWQRRRLKVKPGITGLQQVEARGSLSTLNERVRLDTYYIRKQTFLLDIVILARTVWVVLSGRGAS